jgi:squalene synthase HpnC
VLAKAPAENFSVAPLFLPARVRGDLLAIYGFARLVDDIGDDGDATPDARLALLDWADDEIERAALGDATHAVFRRLTPTIDRCRLDLHPFHDLVEANRVDQRVSRYDTFDDLLGYCRLSANPVGRLVLAVLGATTPSRVRRSDAVCTGLQLAEHWQDVGEDAGRGRVYLPREDLRRFGCDERELLAPRAGDALRALVLHEVERTRPFLDEGAPLVAGLRGRPRLLVAGFVAGGHAALDAIERADGDVLRVACRPRKRRVAAHLMRTTVGRGT